MSFACADGGKDPTETEVRAHEGANRGRSPLKASLAVAAVDEAKGELLERAGFPQDRAGLGSLERWAERFPERRPKRWRTQAALRSAPGGEVGELGRVGGGRAAQALGEGEGALSSFAGNARKRTTG
jgi:hypothetical protein